ncbi:MULTISPECIES: hypothetical protein [unclassified Halomonas]|uniref:hypothetical protein n=1 Tax=unclassified Halomonas TaxID=2609666 RepID=UPI001EF639E2|nr:MULTISPECIES: hypothetical protein [unclassified Halomonas]MCG7589668.1 hypothetical protein [Halomonas sp. McD50-5]MCG7616283.1 hypothetical protein [Halomonas sp. McD50-4]
MKPLRMIIDNAHDVATLTATSEAMQVANTQRSGRSYAWRSENLAPQVIEGTLATARFLSALVLYDHNLTAGGTVRIEYLLNDEVRYDSGPMPAASIIPLGIWRAGIDPWGAQDVSELPIRHFVAWMPSTLTNRYRVTITDPNPPVGYMQIGRIVTGSYYSPPEEMNLSFGVNLKWEDLGEHSRTESGSLRTIGEGEARLLTFNFSHLTQQELTRLSRELLRVKKRTDIYINVYPEAGGMLEAEHAFIARRADSYQHTHTRVNNFEVPGAFMEV